jgi:hypothetical protein
MENKPGNGYTSPFGNGNGATTTQGPASGTHDFNTDPGSHSPKTGGRDFTKESMPQKPSGSPGSASQPNPESIPAGGVLPFPDADVKGDMGAEGTYAQPAVGPKMPFKLGGG